MPTGIYDHSLRINRKKLKCLFCHKVFEVCHSAKRKYCSHICYSKTLCYLKGDKSPSWKGNNVSYGQLHKWLRQNFGKPNKCQICKAIKIPEGKKQFFEWSLIKGKKYQRKRENFWMLCHPCHSKYDFQGVHKSPQTEFKKGHKLSIKLRQT